MNVNIPSKDYYSNMYDVESLTHLSNRLPTANEDIVRIEKLVRENRCINAKEEINKFKENYPELHIIKNALYVKELISKDYINDENLSPKTVALKELSDYLGLPIEKIETKMLVEKPVDEDWKKIKPDVNSEESINNFYMETDSYVYELMAANYIMQTLYSFYVLSKKMKKLNTKTILDYGAGAGTLSILFKQLGYNVIYADLPGKTFDYAKWRFKKRNLDIEMIDLTKEDIDGKEFDIIVCAEVFEHVLKPVKLIENFSKTLAKGNYLIISESAEYTKDFSSHLESNKKYGGNNFISLLSKYGFKKILANPFIPQQIFKKV